MKTHALLLALLAFGCGDTGQDRVTVPLHVAGTELSQPIDATGGVTITLDRADLAFGPLYLCAGANAGDLCDTARLEWLGSIVVHAVDAEPVRAGELQGVTGVVRSWMYDLGLSSQLTQREGPFVLDAARELGDASLVVSGQADVGGAGVAFSASVRVEQTDDTELGIPVVRKSTSETFRHEVTGSEAGLTVRFDPTGWLKDIDFRTYCVHDGDCPEELVIEPDSEAFRGLKNAVVSSSRPSFEWR
jgi:hypothetical protein